MCDVTNTHWKIIGHLSYSLCFHIQYMCLYPCECDYWSDRRGVLLNQTSRLNRLPQLGHTKSQIHMSFLGEWKCTFTHIMQKFGDGWDFGEVIINQRTDAEKFSLCTRLFIYIVYLCFCACACGCVGVRACASTPAVSLSITFKWAESNQCSQQDPALSLPPFPLSHLNFSPPPCSPLHGAARCLLNWLVQVKSGGLKKKKKTREWVALHHIAKSTVSFIIYPFSK